jgi:FkbM family methyltransferase
MKLKSLLWTVGFKPKPRSYGYEVRSFDLPMDGTVQYAKWMHPKDYNRQFSQSHVDQLRQFIQPGDFVIDVGAHSGDFSLPLALAAGGEGAVLAVEPNPYVFESLTETARLNPGKTNIVPLCAAASDREGPIEFRYSDPGYCNGGCLEDISIWQHGHPFLLTVPGVRLSEWIKEHMTERMDQLSFIKIDAEGYDLTVLESLRELIERYQPCVHIEMYRHLKHPQRLQLLRTLQSMDYSVRRIDDEEDWLSGPSINSERLMSKEHYDVFCVHEKSRIAQSLMASV